MNKLLILDASGVQSDQSSMDYGAYRVAIIGDSQPFVNYATSVLGFAPIRDEKVRCYSDTHITFSWFYGTYFNGFDFTILESVYDKVLLVKPEYEKGYVDGTAFMEWFFSTEQAKSFMEE